jgi:DeoR/GlpR family transcriptional regulator of sugar metabolism
MKQNEVKKYLKAIYGKEKVLTIRELVKRMMLSEITVRRRLNPHCRLNHITN